MPNTKSAKKHIRLTARKTSRNNIKKIEFRQAMRKVLDLIQEEKLEKAEEAFKVAQKAIDKAAKAGVIKKNTAARKKSRLIRNLVKAKKK